ncbi:MAG: SpoIIE family protein phosphatase [Syntrophales bacterium]
MDAGADARPYASHRQPARNGASQAGGLRSSGAGAAGKPPGAQLSLEIGRYGERELLALLRGTVERNDHIYGSVAAFEPDVFCVATRLYAPYFHKEKGGLLLTRLERSHSYLFRDWYQIPRELEKPGWSEPYIDQEKGNILMTSYSVPFFENRDGKRRLRGVAASDVSLSALTELVSSIKVLKIAHDIQMGILPKIFPPFPDREEFDIYALIEPAREVGGDFYDFFQIDDTHLCFVIADVSGKGVPASLFMAVAKTLIKATACKGITPDKILCQVNDELSSDNETCMFVTIFCGILDTSNGELLYANGGHNLAAYP